MVLLAAVSILNANYRYLEGFSLATWSVIIVTCILWVSSAVMGGAARAWLHDRPTRTIALIAVNVMLFSRDCRSVSGWLGLGEDASQESPNGTEKVSTLEFRG